MITISYGIAILCGLCIYAVASIMGFLAGTNAERIWRKISEDEHDE